MDNLGSIELINEQNELLRSLAESVRLMAKYGKEYARAESEYKIALAQATLRLRNDGMAVTLIDKVVFGEPIVNEYRLKRDTAEVMYKASQENIQAIKLRIRIVEGQIEREWS